MTLISRNRLTPIRDIRVIRGHNSGAQNMKRRKWSGGLAALVLLAGVVTARAAEGELKLAVIPKCTGGEFWETVEKGARQAAARSPNGAGVRPGASTIFLTSRWALASAWAASCAVDPFSE